MTKMLIYDFRSSEKEFFNGGADLTDFEITFYNERLDENTQISEAERNETVILSVFITSFVSESVINKFKNLQIITTRSTGYNHIDIEACRRRNIAVFNVEDYGRTAVAQYTIGIILAMLRNVIVASNDVKNRRISYERYEGRDISKLTLGVIGTGSIGSAVCETAYTLGMRIYANDIVVNKNLNGLVEYVSFDELIKKSDVITLHIPYIKEFYHLISEKEFNNMKDGAYIINTARGELIDTAALYSALKSGKINGAALDVIECEHLISSGEDFDKVFEGASCECLGNAVLTQKLMSFDNVIITPHAAYNTRESVYTILDTTFNNIKNYFKGFHTNQVV